MQWTYRPRLVITLHDLVLNAIADFHYRPPDSKAEEFVMKNRATALLRPID
jgi:hypothetical protein